MLVACWIVQHVENSGVAKRYQTSIQHVWSNMRRIGLWVRIFPSVHHVVTSTDFCNMAQRKEKFKRCLSVLLVLDELEETKYRARKRDKTREWIRRRQESGHFTNIVWELAAEDTPNYHQIRLQVWKTAISPSKPTLICSIRCVLVQISLSLFLASSRASWDLSPTILFLISLTDISSSSSIEEYALSLLSFRW